MKNVFFIRVADVLKVAIIGPYIKVVLASCGRPQTRASVAAFQRTFRTGRFFAPVPAMAFASDRRDGDGDALADADAHG
jgi:hypothetical protein